MDTDMQSGPGEAHASPAEIRDYVLAMSEQLAEMAARIGRSDIEAKLREAVSAGLRPI